MKLSDIRGEEALDVLAELVDPAVEIMADEEIAEIVRSKQPKIGLVKPILKNHKKSLIQIFAALEREDPEEYVKNMNILTLPSMLIDLLNDPAIVELFSSQGQKMEDESSGSATENTEAEEK